MVVSSRRCSSRLRDSSHNISCLLEIVNARSCSLALLSRLQMRCWVPSRSAGVTADDLLVELSEFLEIVIGHEDVGQAIGLSNQLGSVQEGRESHVVLVELENHTAIVR